MPEPTGDARPGLREAAAVAFLLLLVVLATLVTHARLDGEETYHMSREGLAGALGRALVELNR